MFNWSRMLVLLAVIYTTWQFVVKRSFAHWRLLSSVLIGVMLASTILSGTVLYFDALRQLALKQELGKYMTTEMDMLIQTEWGPTKTEEYARLLDTAESAFDERVAWALRGKIHGGVSPTFFFTMPGNEQQAGLDDARTYFTFMPMLEKHITLMPGGRIPPVQVLDSDGRIPEIEALIPASSALLFGLRVGDRVSAVPVSSVNGLYINVVISGIFEKTLPMDEEFWYLEETALRKASDPAFQTLPLFISEQTFFRGLGAGIPRMQSTYAWLLQTDVHKIDAWNSAAILSNIELMNRSLVTLLPSYGNVTSLDNALRDYDQRIFFSKVPMFVVLTMMALVVLYYVATLSALVVENRRGEVALLRSRGANRIQILTVFILEGVMISALAVSFAPLIAATTISFLGLTPAFNALTSGSWLTVNITRSVYLLSGLGGALSFIAVIIPALRASQVDVIQQKLTSARPIRRTVFQRYYIDVLLLVVSIFLFRQLSEQGSVLVTNRFGEATASQLLLALPGLVLIATSMILLRLFPFVMRLVSKGLSHVLPAGLTMGIWQISRDPTHYARLSLLLILTAGLGVFASSFGATLQRSFEERALFSTGSDLRVSNVRPSYLGDGVSTGLAGSTLQEDLEKAFDQVPGVDLASPMVRASGRDFTAVEGSSYEMFAIDSDRFGDVAWFRDDFSDKPIKELLVLLELKETPEGLPLPNDAVSLNVMVRSDRLHPTVRLSVRLRNSNSEYSNLTLGMLSSGDWNVLEADLDTDQSFLSNRPLTLVSLQIEETALERQLLAGSVLIDEISVISGSGDTQIIEDFDDVTKWHVLRNTEDAVSDGLRAARDVFDVQLGAALFFWDAGSQITARGMFYGSELVPMPVLASKGFMKSTDHRVGEEFEVELARVRVPVKLMGIIDLFPTMETIDKSLLVADMTVVNRYVNLPSTAGHLLPIEVWISATTGIERKALVQNLDRVEGFETGLIQDRAAQFESSKVDPLVGAGWSALLFIAFLAILVLSCVGFLIHAYVSFQHREFQFALLRTVGFSTKQLISMVWLEQTLVVVLGLALGTWMGGRLGEVIIPFLGQNDFGGQVIPPFVIEINWSALFITYMVMLLVFGLITAGIIWFIRRISLHKVLRMGEA